MITSNKYRQEVAQFRNRLNKIIATTAQKDSRILIDTTGNKSRAVPFKSNEQRLTYYGTRRFESVARILSLFEIVRDSEKLHQRPKPVELETTGAVWQAFRGNSEANACHTCPSHLQLDGKIPTLITKNHGLQRHIIIEFADCVLMPRAINEIDIVMDEAVGKSAFLAACGVMLNEKGTSWQEGLSLFSEEARECLGPAKDILLDTSGRKFKSSNSMDEYRIEMVCAYYQGMFLTPLNTNAIENLASRIETEMGTQNKPTY